jgi:carboxypeptidase C (cathepsin A)
MTEKGEPLQPYHLIDNEYSILDLTDLVFIDPISTGYSKPAPGEDAKQFHGVDEDIKSVAEFIRLYITRNARWDSPKFLAGESYGTTRAAGLVGYLHDEFNMYFNGILLVSSVLNFQAYDFVEGNDLAYILFLPSYTATAWYHKKLPPDLQKLSLPQAVKESQDFALSEYTLAMMKGDILQGEEREKIVGKLARYTGIDSQIIEKNNLRLSIYRFAKSLLKKKNIGRFDSRFVGLDNNFAGDSYSFDPSAEIIFGAFTANINQYVRKDLKWEKDDNYKILANVSPWNYGKAINQYLNIAETLKEAMTKNSKLTVFIANGYYDLATPFCPTEYTFNHLGLDPSLLKNISMSYYEAGHMMYIHKPSLIKFKHDVSNFINKTLSKEQKLSD